MEKITFKHPVVGKHVELGVLKNFLPNSGGHFPLKATGLETTAFGDRYYTTIKYELTPEFMENPFQAELLKQHFSLNVNDEKYQKSIKNVCVKYPKYNDCPRNNTYHIFGFSVILVLIIFLIVYSILRNKSDTATNG